MEIFKQIFDEFSIPLADNKTQGPVIFLPCFLCLNIVIVKRCIRIHRSTILKLKGFLKCSMNRKKVKKKES